MKTIMSLILSRVNIKIVKFLKGFSLEITPFVADKIDNLSQFIKPSTTIFITFLPGSDYKDTINTAKNKT